MWWADPAVAVSTRISRQAALGALDVPRDRCRAHALTFTWQASARQFLDNVRQASGVFVGAA